MTTGTPQPLAAHAPIQNFTTNNPSHEPAPPAAPTKRDLASWWKNFKRNTKKEDENKGMYKTGIQNHNYFISGLWDEIILRSFPPEIYKY